MAYVKSGYWVAGYAVGERGSVIRGGEPQYDVYTQREIERERLARRISKKASEVIEQIAREQAQRDELDGIAAAAELAAAMEESELKWRAQYEAALNAYREVIRAEMVRMAAERSRIEQEAARRAMARRNAAIALLLLTEY